MTESELKRYLIRSIHAQDGYGHRFEDKYAIGWPDLLLILKSGPVVFAEVKLVKGLCLEATPSQETVLHQLWRPPACYSLMLGYHAKSGRLYAGHHSQEIETLPYVSRPKRIDSADWKIAELLKGALGLPWVDKQDLIV